MRVSLQPRFDTQPAVKAHGDRVEMIAVSRLGPYPKQLQQIADSIRCFGFNPVLVDDGDMILAGYGRVEGQSYWG